MAAIQIQIAEYWINALINDFVCKNIMGVEPGILNGALQQQNGMRDC